MRFTRFGAQAALGWVAMLMLVELLGLISVPAHAQATKSDAVPRFERANCLVPVPDDTKIECGYLVVLEDRTKPDGRTVRLPVGIARSLSDSPRPDPVVYLHGGPGMSVLRRVWWWPRTLFRQDRDVIVVDQRGAGLSEPALDCPELGMLAVETLTKNITLAQAAEYHAERALLCRARLTRDGIDLAMYTNKQSAADLDELRRVLGYKEWNLFSWSAGTRLALTILRDRPEGVRSAILDSIYMPPGADYYANLMPYAAQTLQTVFDACNADSTCKTAYPDLKALFFDTVDRLNAQPLRFAVNHPRTGVPYQAEMNGPAFVGLLYRALYEEWNIATLPLLIMEVRQGNARSLPALLRDPLAEPSLYRVGMNHSIHCSEAAPFTSLATIDASWARVDPRFMGFYHFDVDPHAFMKFCKQWITQPADPTENEPVHSAIPALIFMGTFDPASPPIYGKLAEQTLTRSFYVEFPTMGHFSWEYGGSCPKSIAVAFLNSPENRPDTSCIDGMPKVSFVTERDIYALPGLYRLIDAINAGGYSLQTVGPLLFAIVVFLAAPIFLLVSLVRRKPNRAARRLWLAHVFVALIAGLNPIGIVLLFRMMNLTEATNYGLLNFGLPADAGPLLFIPLTMGVLAAGLMIMTAIAWAKRYWSLAGRVYYSLVVVAAFGVATWMTYWGLLPIWS